MTIRFLNLKRDLFPLAFTGCDKKEKIKTVDWYMAPDNKAAYKAKLAECRNNPGSLKGDPNCMNAMTAQHKLFARQPDEGKDKLRNRYLLSEQGGHLAGAIG